MTTDKTFCPSLIPRHLVIKIMSFSDLDTKRELNIPPGRLNVPRELQHEIHLSLVRQKEIPLTHGFLNCVNLHSPSKVLSDCSPVLVYTIATVTEIKQRYVVYHYNVLANTSSGSTSQHLTITSTIC